MNRVIKTMSVLAFTVLLVGGCSTAPSSSGARSDLVAEARNTIGEFKQNDPSIERFFSSAAGYAVYPAIGKGGLVVGGAFGRGALFEGNTFTSYCDVTQGTVGLQIGGQSYSQIIFFQTQESLNEFKNGAMTFSAQATAVAAKYGAAATMAYSDGVAVYVGDQAGLMAEASVGGQKFSVIRADNTAFAGDVRPNNDRDGNFGVYGYATDQDPGWSNDSTYNRQYDATQSRTITGQVVAISEFTPARNSQQGRQISVRDNDGKTHTIHLGPVSYLDVENKLSLRQGDTVTVNGAMTRFESSDVIQARDVTGPDGRRIELRDSDGRSRWIRNGSSNNNGNSNNDLNRNNNNSGNNDINRNNPNSNSNNGTIEPAPR